MKLMQMLLSQSEAGAETYFEKVAAALAKDASITQRLVIEEQPSREKRLQASGVDFSTLPMGKVKKPLFYNYSLKKHVKEFEPDLIVTWVNRASRKCPSTSAVVVGRLGGYYDIKNYKKCDHLIVNTPDLVYHVVSNGWPKTKVSMISNFGDLPETLEISSSLPEIPTGHKVLLALGRLHQKKAHDTVIKALPMIPDATLLIAGTGELENELKSLADSLGVSERVKFLGLRKDIRQLFDLADVCVFPSRFEPLGNVVLEAWATNTPIVAASSTGPAWLITHNENGLLFDIDDVNACASEVNRVLSDTALADKLTESGFAEFNNNFSMDVIVNKYKNLFETLIKEKKERS
ncbi:glycosyltransferase [Neptunomonas phycophila]|uniref:glycosyltransferase n=1 Tax=Neptunomonas phycophila TaxID=1572645 RepID=UPI001BEBAF02|nr:glycosyltransferase [Neptunomonas phycophila]MBT3144647.1 glycosyltransferase [Neptunomonas phycophila]